MECIFVIVEIDWREEDSYGSYKEDRNILAASRSLEEAKTYVEEIAEIWNKDFKWNEFGATHDYFYYEDDGHTARGTRFSIRTVLLV